MKHYEFVEPQGMHEWCFVSATDPALDVDNEVSAYKAWFDTTSERLLFRNAGNTAWTYVGPEL